MEKKVEGNKTPTGAKGEATAAQWLEERGYALLYKNWRYKRCEVDIIAVKNNILHFIEVKTAAKNSPFLPEYRVGKAKLLQLKKAAEAFLFENPNWHCIQFDILAINGLSTAAPEMLLIEDVF